jgi:hypothetical protein
VKEITQATPKHKLLKKVMWKTVVACVKEAGRECNSAKKTTMTQRWMKKCLHSADDGLASPDFFLNESFNDGIFMEWVGLVERALFFSLTPTADAMQGKQLFGRRPQSSSIPPPPPGLGLSSPEMLTISSWLTEDLLSEFPLGSSLDLGFLWWRSDGCAAPLKLPPLGSFSMPFNENASAESKQEVEGSGE